MSISIPLSKSPLFHDDVMSTDLLGIAMCIDTVVPSHAGTLGMYDRPADFMSEPVRS